MISDKMIRILFIILIIITACTTTSEIQFVEKPKDLIDQITFTSVLKEVMIKEEISQLKDLEMNGDSLFIDYPFKVLFKKKGITPLQFESSFEYYAANKEVMKTIYTDIMDDLSRQVNTVK